MKQILVSAIVPLLLFVAIWAPRVIALDAHVTADEGRWLERSAKFTAALVHQDWDATFQREHPGVTTQWAGLLGLLQTMPDFPQKTRANFDAYNQIPDYWPDASEGISPLKLLAAGRWWTVLFVALSLTLAYFPLKRLLGAGLAALAVLFVAWSPMAVAFTRYLHPDSLVAVLSLVSFCFFASWLYVNQRWRDLVISGSFMGLAWLSKTPAAALVFAGGGAIALEIWKDRSADRDREESASWQSLLLGYLLWGAVASAAFFLLWPVMWTSPLQTFQQIFATMTGYAGGHDNPNFFLGRVVDDPGILFYPVAYLFRATPATLAGLVMAAAAFPLRMTPFDRRPVRKTALVMLIFALAFLVLMTIIGKKFDRYILPTFLSLDVVAALGWAALAQWIAAAVDRRRRSTSPQSAKGTRATTAMVIALLVMLVALGPLHGLLTALHFPYYLTYFNPMVGGTRRAPEVLFTGWGEGLDQVGAWLDQQPTPDLLHVLSWYYYGPLSYYFSGNATGVQYGSRMPWLDADYVVLYINQVQREIPTKAAVDFFLDETPVHTVSVQDMTMARVYDLNAIVAELLASAPPAEALPMPAQWTAPRLTAFRSLRSAPIASALPVELAWESLPERELKASLRLFSEDGTLVAQQDRRLEPEMLLTLFVPPDAVPGPYSLLMMVYDEESHDPMPAEDGQELVTMAAIELTE